MLYLVQAGEGGPVKIGVTNDVRRRVANMQTTSPVEYKVLRVLEGGRDQELSLHSYFSHLHIRGEWFGYSPEMLTVLPADIPSAGKLLAVRSPRVPKTVVDRAAAAVGGAETFRKRFGIERRAFFYWRRRGIPLERVPEISRETGIPKHELRPDFWDAPSEGRAA